MKTDGGEANFNREERDIEPETEEEERETYWSRDTVVLLYDRCKRRSTNS
jgi:hypothetical protein